MQKRLPLLIIGLILVLSLVIPVTAQDTFAEYRWDDADIALRYPADWDDPLALFNTEKNRECFATRSGLSDITHAPARNSDNHLHVDC